MTDDPSSERNLGQDKQKAGYGEVEDPPATIELPVCACVGDVLAALSLELSSCPTSRNDVLRKFTCPGCGRVYLTNITDDLCPDCREKIDRNERKLWQTEKQGRVTP